MSNTEKKNDLDAMVNVITTQLRVLGVRFQDEAFNSIRAGGGEEQRIVRAIANAVLVEHPECQTGAVRSGS